MDKVLAAFVELITTLVSDSSSPLYFNASTAPKGIKRVYKGDPSQIIKDDQPCIIVRPVSSEWEKRMSRYDRKIHMVEVIIVAGMDLYKESTPADPSAPTWLSTMVDMMEDTNTAQSTTAKTIMGLFGANPKLPYTDSGTKYAAVDTKPQSVDYVFNSSRGFPTFEVIALFRVTSQGDRA